MSDDASTYARLAAPFSLDEHAKVNKGGFDQTYAPWTAYVERMTEVLGANNWSNRVVREGFTETECWVLVQVRALIDGQWVIHEQYGSEPIYKGRDQKPTTDLLKSVASDALKKAISLFGPGLYLSVKEERLVIEAAMKEAIKAAAAELRGNPTPRQQPTAAPTPAAGPGSQASRSVSTPTASPAAPTSSSTPATPAETTQERWARLVASAEVAQLPTLGAIKAIDPNACPEPQLARHCERLAERLATARKGAA